MRSIELKSEGRVLLKQCWVASSFFSRFKGLMGRTSLSDEEGVAFPKCNSIHTFFMRMPIDVVLVDKKGVVVGVHENLAPWRLLLPRKATRHVVELKAFRSRALGIKAGVTLVAEGVWA